MQVVGLSGVLAIAAGSCYRMALLIEYGWSYRVYAWGRNDSGQLGLDDPSIVKQTTPARASLPDVQSMAGGGEHAVAVRDTSEAFTWGANDYGQLGNPAQPSSYLEYSFGFVMDASQGYPCPNFSEVSAIAAGYDHCLALRGGTLWAWSRWSPCPTSNRPSAARITPWR